MNIRFRHRQWTGAPPADVAPGPGEVIAWIAFLPLDAPSRDRLSSILSDAERERMAGFIRPADRERFLAGRGILRAILGQCLQIPPESVAFSASTRGKPLLAPDQGAPFHFNVSHSGALVAVALSVEWAVGVDVEESDRLTDWRLVAERILSSREAAEMETVPRPDRPRAFLNAWTRKEAVLKATGEGLVGDLATIEVSLAPGTPTRLLSLGGIAPDPADFALHELSLPCGYVGCVAACRTWPARRAVGREGAVCEDIPIGSCTGAARAGPCPWPLRQPTGGRASGDSAAP